MTTPPRPRHGVPPAPAQAAGLLRRAGALATLGTAVLVAACGGGGGGGGDSPATTNEAEFRLQDAYKTFLTFGRDRQRFDVRGTIEGRGEVCTGTAEYSNTPLRDTTFEDRPASVSDFSTTLTGSCAGGGTIEGVTRREYFQRASNTNVEFSALGSHRLSSGQSSVVLAYGRFEPRLADDRLKVSPGQLQPMALPRTVRAGQEGELGTEYSYFPGSTGPGRPSGRTDWSYKVTDAFPNTTLSGTAMRVELTSKTYAYIYSQDGTAITGTNLSLTQVYTFRLFSSSNPAPLTSTRVSITSATFNPPLTLELTPPQ